MSIRTALKAIGCGLFLGLIVIGCIDWYNTLTYVAP